MRVTNEMMTNNILNDLSNVYQQLNTYGVQLSSGKQLNQPSDNPAAVNQAMTTQNFMSQNTQYQSSLQSAQQWLQVTNSSLQQLTNVMTQIRTLTVQAANDTNTGTERTAIANQIQQLQQQMIAIGNTQSGDSYIFAGTQTLTTPFNSATGAYSGNTGAVSHQIAPATSVQVNIDPTQLFTSGSTGLFSVTNQLTRDLTQNGNPVPAYNTGNEQVSVAGTTSIPANTSYIIQVTGTDSSGNITGIQYSTNGSTWTTLSSTTPTSNAFSIGGNTVTFAKGSVAAATGDTFSYNSGSVALLPSSPISFIAGGNFGNESLVVNGAYSGTGTQPNYMFKATGLDSNNNVNQIEFSTDGGTTWTSVVDPTDTNGAGPLAAGTATNFTLGNGQTLAWNQSTKNQGMVYSAAFASNSQSITGTYSGTGTQPNYTFKAAGYDTNGNVDLINLSTDNGQTWSTVSATGVPPFPAGTTTTFSLGNGQTLNWSQQKLTNTSANALSNSVGNDTFTYVPNQTATSLTNDLGMVDSAMTNLTSVTAKMGALESNVNSYVSLDQTQATFLTQTFSQLVDTNLPTATTQYTTLQALLQAALKVDASSIQPTLAQFLP